MLFWFFLKKQTDMHRPWAKSSKLQKERKERKKERKEERKEERKNERKKSPWEKTTKNIEMHFHKIGVSCNVQLISNNPNFKGFKIIPSTKAATN